MSCKFAKKNEETKKQIIGLKEQIGTLEEENHGLKAKLAEKEAYIKEVGCFFINSIEFNYLFFRWKKTPETRVK